MRKKTWLSWSSGKDSAWALHVLRQSDEYEVMGLFTTINSAFGRVAMHAVRVELLHRQAQAIGLPLHLIAIPYPCSDQQYAAVMSDFMAQADNEGVRCMAFGDLYLPDVRRYREERMRGSGIEAVFPLWGMPTRELLGEMLAGGLRARLTCVDPRVLPAGFVGRELTLELLGDMPSGVDPCGENGEFHTFVFDGPMFAQPLDIEMGEVVTRDGFVFADCRLRELHVGRVAVIGGGPAGLMAAEVLSQGGVRVDVYDAMPTAGRKFLRAGKGGMNITHAGPLDDFLSRYGARSKQLKPILDSFGPDALREWVHDLDIPTFVGSSGRVFPADMKAAPLLRAWLHRLREAGVRFHMRHRWRGWGENGALRFDTAQGEITAQVDAVVLALGGGSWARLGSDGAWVPLLAQRGISVVPLRPANCGFDVGWSKHFSGKFAGHPLKSVSVSFTDAAGHCHSGRGDVMVTASGVEGGPIYALSAMLRDEIEARGEAVVHIDLVPGKDLQRVIAEVDHPRGARSMSGHLQSRANIRGVQSGLLRELLPKPDFDHPERLASAIKSLPLRLIAPRPLDEAISSAGGVAFEALDEHLMVRSMPGVFCAGEMLDWEAPTGGYLLTACFSSGRHAGRGVLDWLGANCHA